MRVHIKTTYSPHDCGMCGPSFMQESTVTVDCLHGPPAKETVRMSLCDNSDPWDEEALLCKAFEMLGYEVTIERE